MIIITNMKLLDMFVDVNFTYELNKKQVKISGI